MNPRPEIAPVSGALGAEMRGLDLSARQDDASVEATLDALYEHKVIFIRGQTLTPQQQIDFSAQLAPRARR